jgi:serine O-acetyltransferase
MGTFKAIKEDLRFLKDRFSVSYPAAILTNRGFHALLFYRISNSLYKKRIPLIPLVLTRITQVFYAIDIDYKATIEGGIIIIHGVGIVIGQGVIVASKNIIYHGVTLGRKRQILEMTADDGFPHIQSNCVLGAGAKLIGNVNVGANSIIGPNVVLMQNVPFNSIVRCSDPIISQKN